MAPTSPAAARLDLFYSLATDLIKGTPKSTLLDRVYQYEVAPGTQLRSTKSVVTIRHAGAEDPTEFAFALTVYADTSKGFPSAEAALDDGWWAVEQLLDGNSQFTRGLWSDYAVATNIAALFTEANVRCVRGTGLQSV